MFGQSDNKQPGDQPTDFSSAVNDITGTSTGTDQPAPQNWGHPGNPTADANPAPAGQITPVQPPEFNASASAAPASLPSTPSSDNSSHPAETSQNVNDLIELKQKVLGELSPLVEHLDQNHEEKFNTLMMMIQASDDQSLIQQAYDEAQKITDEKSRAQALLDVVNEINYFTQQAGSK